MVAVKGILSKKAEAMVEVRKIRITAITRYLEGVDEAKKLRRTRGTLFCEPTANSYRKQYDQPNAKTDFFHTIFLSYQWVQSHF